MPPNIDVDYETVELASNGEARRVLAQAAAEDKTFWAAVHVPAIAHPEWWPRKAVKVPGFEHMIVGSGDAGIGMHRDRYTADGEGGERLVSTYLALGCGRKHVVMLPPTAEAAQVAQIIGGSGCDDAYGRRVSQRAKLPARPTPDMLELVLGCGGYWFDIEAASSNNGHGEGGSSTRSDDEDGGHGPDATAEAEDEDEEDDEDDEDSEFVPVCLFIPSGWWHWLAGDAEWHVAWSGSFFPGSDSHGERTPRGQQQQHGSSSARCGRGGERGAGKNGKQSVRRGKGR